MGLSVHRLQGVIQRYSWGSRHRIAALLGRPTPSEHPEAELWMGAHPNGPASVEIEGRWVPFDEAIAGDPHYWLGSEVLAGFGARLPFLLKVLAVEMPLSLQVHPDAARAALAFSEDQQLPAARRRYVDPHPKPELICALTPFHALCGFRGPQAIEAWLAGAGLADVWQRAGGASPGAFLGAWLRMPASEREARIARLLDYADGTAAQDAVSRRICELAAIWPGDPGLVAPVLMNAVALEPGEALFLPPGELHCYLSGAAVEIMAASDNVVRAGLTQKAIHTVELLAIGRFEPGTPDRVVPDRSRAGEAVYRTSAQEFELSRIEPGDGPVRVQRKVGPEVLFCASGRLELESSGGRHSLVQGEGCAIPADLGSYALAGEGVLFRASLPVGDAVG